MNLFYYVQFAALLPYVIARKIKNFIKRTGDKMFNLAEKNRLMRNRRG